MNIINPFNSSFTKKNLNISDERIRTCYTLRKNKLIQKNFKQRYESYIKQAECSLEINLSDEIINSFPKNFLENFKNFEEKDKIYQIFSILSTSNDFQHISFCVYVLRTISEKFTNSSEIESLIPFELINTIFRILTTTTNNMNIIYEATTFLINITKHSSLYTVEFSKNKNYLNTFIQTFNLLSNIYIRGQILLLFGNIIQEGEWEALQNIMSSLPLCKILSDYLVTNLENIPNNIKWIIIWNIGLIIKYYPLPNFESFFLSLHPPIEKICLMIQTDINKLIFYESLDCLRILTNKVSQYLSSTSSSQIIPLMNEIFSKVNFYKSIDSQITCSKSNDILYNIFNIMTNLSYISNDYLDLFCENNIYITIENFLQEILYKEKITNKKFAFIELLNFIYNSTLYLKTRKRIVRKNNIIKYLAQIAKGSSDKEIITNIFDIILSILDSNESDKNNNYIEMIRLEIPELLLIVLTDIITKESTLTSVNKEISENCLDGILKFLIYGNDLVKGTNILFFLYEKSGLKDVLEKMSVQGEGKIAQLCTEITEKYFK